MVDTAQLQKADLAARAEKAIQKTGWLPESLRIVPVIEATESGSGVNHGDRRACKVVGCRNLSG